MGSIIRVISDDLYSDLVARGVITDYSHDATKEKEETPENKPQTSADTIQSQSQTSKKAKPFKSEHKTQKLGKDHSCPARENWVKFEDYYTVRK